MMPVREIHVSVPIVIEPDGDSFHAYAPALSGCHVGGNTREEARRNIEDAVYLYISALLERGEPLPLGYELGTLPSIHEKADLLIPVQA